MLNDLELSSYVTIIVSVPETHADEMREVMGRAGAGKFGEYSFCSFSTKGIARFLPHKGSDPYIGEELVMEAVVEERIETVCERDVLEHVVEEIKKAHPYEATVIDIYPIYTIACKFSR